MTNDATIRNLNQITRRISSPRGSVALWSTLLLTTWLAVACGNDPEPDPSWPNDGTERSKTVDSFTCPEGSIVSGTNTLMVNGMARTLVADFPTDTNARMGILFSWHGYNQPEGEHRTSTNLNPNGNPALPVVVITPDDVDFELPIGLDWQLDEGTVEKNVDLQFFEAMVGCLNAQYDIDPTRIYSLGYSAGSVMTSLIHSVYPRIVRVVVCISGMWFSDPAQGTLISLGGGSLLMPTWPALHPEDTGTVLLTHGGATDIAAGIINLEAMAQAAFPFLKAANRVVIDCPHNSGHVGNPEITPPIISKFISDNPTDELSPYLAGGYAGFPASCTLRLP
jgi:predicted esterase